MAIELDDLKPLADILLEKGAPILATAVLGPVGGNVAAAVLPKLAEAFNLDPRASAAEIVAAASNDSNASGKVAAVQDAHSELLDVAKAAQDANVSALSLEPSFVGRLYVGGWRPAMGWGGVIALLYQIVASVRGWTPISFDTFATIMSVWAALAGVRGVEMVKGVARMNLKTKTAKA